MLLALLCQTCTVAEPPAKPADYHHVMSLADGAWLGLAAYGHYRGDRRLEIAGTLGLLVTGPLIHAWKQRPTYRREVTVLSIKIRPIAPFAVLAFYTLGKVIGGFESHDSQGCDPSGGGFCSETSWSFNRDYNWKAVWAATGLMIAVLDVEQAYQRGATLGWGVTPLPVRGGGGLSVSGRF